MRVGIVCPYDLGAYGGVQRICLELAQRLGRAGYDPVLVGPGRRPGADSAGPVVRLPANRSQVPLTLHPSSVSTVRRLLADTDLVHVHEPLVPLVGWSSLRTGKPTVATFHADPAPWTRRLYRGAARLGALLLEDVEVTAPSAVAADALPRSWGPVSVVPNAIEVAAYHLNVTRRPQRVVFVGRDDPRKGLDVLLAAWPMVRRDHPQAELVALGPRRSAAPGVVFRGPVSEPEKREVLASAAVMAAPNRGGESFGIVVAEGMAAGCAVVASAIPAFREVVGDTGVLVPPGDPLALARAVSDLIGRPRRAASLGEAARTAVARFDWDRVLALYRAVYESAVNRHATSIRRRKE